MQGESRFAFVMKTAAAGAVAAAAVTFALYRAFPAGWLLSTAITFTTVGYHFIMRLIVGYLVPNTFNFRSRWFQPLAFESILYRKLKLRKWKDRVPTYDPRAFSLESNTLSQVLSNMCQAEVVHEIIIAFSFIPLLFSLFWDSFWVFFITSILAAALDCMFVLLQRYNRPRLMRLLEKQQKKGNANV